MKKIYALLDEEGNPVRYFNYPAEGTVEIKVSKMTFEQLIKKFGECLL